MEVLWMFLGLFMVVFFTCTSLLVWNDWRYKRDDLPPGTMGWPFFGETRQFTKDGPNFMKARRERYGDLFKTHFFGSPTVVSMDPDLNRYILMNEKEGLVPGYPSSMRNILGTSNIAAVHGPPHRTLRGAIVALLNPTMVKDNLLPKMDGFMRSFLSDWDGKVIELQGKTKDMAILSSLMPITGTDTDSLSEITTREFYKIYWGTLSLPIDLPGTNYRCGLEARTELTRIMRELIHKRKASSNTNDDMLEALQNFKDYSKTNLTEDQVIDSVVTLLYSGLETFSAGCMMALKYLHENPLTLQELRKEHLEIRKRKSVEDAIDWDDYKAMEFTRGVIYETLRLASVVNGVMRLTTRDIEMKGSVIPKGWRIYVYTREINYDPFLYPEPFSFNPWRWKDKSLESHPHFMLFGGGSRLCVGKQLGELEIALFLHYLVTRYNWEFVGGEKIIPFPRITAPNGLHIKVTNLKDYDA